MIKQLSLQRSASQTEVSLDRIAEIYRELEEKKLPKGYWIVHIEVKDPAGYENYENASSKILSKYGAKFLVRGGEQITKEGAEFMRNVVVEFPSYEIALQAYESDDYQQALAVLDGGAERAYAVVEGYD